MSLGSLPAITGHEDGYHDNEPVGTTQEHSTTARQSDSFPTE